LHCSVVEAVLGCCRAHHYTVMVPGGSYCSFGIS
jgi:hypothetical protein